MRTARNAGIAVFLPLVLIASLSVPAQAKAPQGQPGAAGAGDPYFPRQGNGGYDAASYNLHIGYTPATKTITGTAKVLARATIALSRFDLDLRRNMQVTSVLVDDRPATFTQPAAKVQELVITPARVLRKGAQFTVEVTYSGTATPVIDPDGSLDGFIPTPDGAFVAGEPQGAPSWYPVNDTPTDKATYRVSITVPTGLTAVSNGQLIAKRYRGATTSWDWRLNKPVSSYLVTATIGTFNTEMGTTASGLRFFTAVDPSQQAKAQPVLAQLPKVVDYFTSVYGRYPFGDTGAIVDDAPDVGYALETATRPVFDRAPDVLTLAHELAHQWYGDEVTLARWRDIWLNEGFAEFSSWLYDEHTGGETGAQHLDDLLALPASDEVWNPPPGNPGSNDSIFTDSVYERGAGTLQALREKVGDAVFFTIMRGWLTQHPYSNAKVRDFTAYAAKVAHVNLDHFFQVWLFAKGKPSV